MGGVMNSFSMRAGIMLACIAIGCSRDAEPTIRRDPTDDAAVCAAPSPAPPPTQTRVDYWTVMCVISVLEYAPVVSPTDVDRIGYVCDCTSGEAARIVQAFREGQRHCL